MKSTGCIFKKWSAHPIIFLLVLLFVAHSDAWWKKSKETGTASSSDQSQEQPSRSYESTFLDTINASNEIALSDKDFIPVAMAVSGPPTSAKTGETVSPEQMIYRVQCLASSQIETVRAEKKSLESRTKLPVYIETATPFYKLLVGDFPTREKAKDALIDIKGLGYADAWVVESSKGQGR